MPQNVQILSTGSYVPERVVTNVEVDSLLGESTNEWLISNVGIRERRWMALKRAGVSASKLDPIIVSTDTPDYLSPSTSYPLLHRL
jgi:3-oxoacyl-[acyl-carrier-protein] synthase-3